MSFTQLALRQTQSNFLLLQETIKYFKSIYSIPRARINNKISGNEMMKIPKLNFCLLNSFHTKNTKLITIIVNIINSKENELIIFGGKINSKKLLRNKNQNDSCNR